VSEAILRKSVIAFIVLIGFGVVGLWTAGKLPTSFVHDEDQGYFYSNIQLPNAASLQRTEEVLAKIQKIALAILALKTSRPWRVQPALLCSRQL
jgi:multidrug efflux pump subunit AcrB